MTDAPDRTTLVLTAADLDGLLSFDDHLAAARDAFGSSADGRGLPPGIVHVEPPGGELHVKVGGVGGPGSVVGLKAAGAYPGNPAVGLPRAMGVLLLVDGHTGRVLAVMPAASVGPLRTAAATTVAADLLAPAGVRRAAICGAGRQAELHARFLAHALDLTELVVWSRSASSATAFCERLGPELDLAVGTASSPADACRGAGIVVTATASREAFLPADAVEPGTFVGAVGADSVGKAEVEPALLARATVVVDVAEQSLHVGDLQHAVAAGLCTADSIAATLGEIVVGAHPGRTRDDEIIVFDSTGTGFQDAAAARTAYRKATTAGRGLAVDLLA